MSKAIGMRDIAKAADLSVATVSRALRGVPSVSSDLREVVVAKARELGYEFNPYVGQLMSAMRRQQGESTKGNVAMIWYDGFPPPTNKQLSDLQREALIRADELGYCMDQFDYRQHTSRGLLKIMRNRGIRGVIISLPGRSSGKIHLNLRLDDFACVSMGWSIYSPTFHNVRFDQFQAIRLAVHHAKRCFGSAIAALVDFRYDRRTDGSYRGAFFAHHPGGPIAAQKLFFDINRFDLARFSQAVESGKIRGLITQNESSLPSELFEMIPRENIIYLDDHTEAIRFGSVDFRYHLLGQRAVNLLVATLQRNEIGVPDVPTTVIVSPLWVPAAISF